MRFLLLLGAGITEIFFYVVAYFIEILLLITWGYTGPLGLLVEIVSGFCIASVFRNHIWRYAVVHTPLQTRNRVALECVVYVVLLQIVLIVVVPMSSILPEPLIERIGIVYPLEKTTCDVRTEIKMMESLWGKQITFNDVHFVQGGLEHILRLLEVQHSIPSGSARSAMTFGTTIYFADVSVCPNGHLYIHEMTHVWQMTYRRNTTFGWRTIPTWIWEAYTQYMNPDVLYNYGGPEGLLKAKDEEKRFSNFGIEQQAMIVEDRYSANAGYSSSPEGFTYTNAYKELLEWYVRKMLVGE